MPISLRRVIGPILSITLIVGLGYFLLITPDNPIMRVFRGEISDIESDVIIGPYPVEKDFIRLKKPRYLLLFGDASVDYKGINKVATATERINYVPSYESRESLEPLQTYVSDDYFGLLAENQGEWLEGNDATNEALSVGIGRIPARSFEEATKNPEAAVDAMLKANAKAGQRDSLIVGLKLTTPLYHTPETEKLRPFRVSPKDMNDSFALLLEYGGLEKSAGKADDYYTNEFLP